MLLFGLEELRVAAMRLPSIKSPGPDGMIIKVLLAVVRWNLSLVVRVLNACLKAGTIPRA